MTSSAFYLRGGVFAFLHQGEKVGRHGVLICPPTGHEQVHAHRALRHLADALAQAGFPTLRLDYTGTGDSARGDHYPGLASAWLDDIAEASGWMRSEMACEAVTLIGLRLGATLAAFADVEMDGLILWAPMVKGRAYVREAKALALTSGRPSVGEDIEAAGFTLTRETVEAMGRLDLTQARPRCRRALIIDRDDAPADQGLLADVAERCVLPGYHDMLAEPHHTKVPAEAIRRIIEWMGEARESVPARPLTLPTAADVSGLVRERVCPVGGLFGVLSEPADRPTSEPLVVLLNAGSAYHVGPNRLHVLLGRHLAGAGLRCLRLDLAGLGDSPAADPATENHAYSPTMFHDISRAIDGLRDERVVLMGLCSGAYAAFQAAARLPHANLVESVVVNPLTFHWVEGMSLDVSPAHRVEASRAVMSSLWRPSKWWKFLTGGSRLSVFGAFRAVYDGLTGRRTSRRGRDDDPLAHPAAEDIPGDLRRIVAAGRHVTFVFSRSDPGHGLLKASAEADVERLRSAGKASLHVIEDSDHTFSWRGGREVFLRTMAEHLSARYRAG
jgi:pimeloyl-ACP methyl ester carboxylesterase